MKRYQKKYRNRYAKLKIASKLGLELIHQEDVFKHAGILLTSRHGKKQQNDRKNAREMPIPTISTSVHNLSIVLNTSKAIERKQSSRTQPSNFGSGCLHFVKTNSVRSHFLGGWGGSWVTTSPRSTTPNHILPKLQLNTGQPGTSLQWQHWGCETILTCWDSWSGAKLAVHNIGVFSVFRW